MHTIVLPLLTLSFMKNNTLLSPPLSYGAVSLTGNAPNTPTNDQDSDSDVSYEIPPSFAVFLEKTYSSHNIDNDDDDDHPDNLSQRLLTRAQSFSLPHDTDRGFRGTTIETLLVFTSPHESLSRQLDLLLSIPLFAICHVSIYYRKLLLLSI